MHKNHDHDDKDEENCRMPDFYACIHCGKYYSILSNWLDHQWRCPLDLTPLGKTLKTMVK